MKTLLMWGVGSDFSGRVARTLAAEGHRLLLVGQDQHVLEALDATLAQSELHRLTATTRSNELADWVREQNVGLDGLVLFPPAPEPTPNVLVPRSINLRSGERSFFYALETIRELLPELRRGKKPKRVLVVLDWFDETGPSPLGAVLTETWHAALSPVTQELNKEGSHFNVLHLRDSTHCPQAPRLPSLQPDETALSPALESEINGALSSLGTELPPPTEYVMSALTLIGMCFSPAMQFFNGQFLRHPSAGAVSAVRQ